MDSLKHMSKLNYLPATHQGSPMNSILYSYPDRLQTYRKGIALRIACFNLICKHKLSYCITVHISFAYNQHNIQYYTRQEEHISQLNHP